MGSKDLWPNYERDRSIYDFSHCGVWRCIADYELSAQAVFCCWKAEEWTGYHAQAFCALSTQLGLIRYGLSARPALRFCKPSARFCDTTAVCLASRADGGLSDTAGRACCVLALSTADSEM